MGTKSVDELFADGAQADTHMQTFVSDASDLVGEADADTDADADADSDVGADIVVTLDEGDGLGEREGDGVHAVTPGGGSSSNSYADASSDPSLAPSSPSSPVGRLPPPFVLKRVGRNGNKCSQCGWIKVGD